MKNKLKAVVLGLSCFVTSYVYGNESLLLEMIDELHVLERRVDEDILSYMNLNEEGDIYLYETEFYKGFLECCRGNSNEKFIFLDIERRDKCLDEQVKKINEIIMLLDELKRHFDEFMRIQKVYFETDHFDEIVDEYIKKAVQINKPYGIDSVRQLVELGLVLYNLKEGIRSYIEGVVHDYEYEFRSKE